MTVKSILEAKGRDVVTAEPATTMQEVARLLGEKRIGAVVVTDANGRIAGILSERDIVRVIGASGAAGLSVPVAEAMTKNVRTCSESHTINEVMEIMTQSRFRHLPVESSGRLAGIISIGDVVKRRIEDVEQEAEQIRTYIATA